jgi:hypothetical protein
LKVNDREAAAEVVPTGVVANFTGAGPVAVWADNAGETTAMQVRKLKARRRESWRRTTRRRQRYIEAPQVFRKICNARAVCIPRCSGTPRGRGKLPGSIVVTKLLVKVTKPLDKVTKPLVEA